MRICFALLVFHQVYRRCLWRPPNPSHPPQKNKRSTTCSPGMRNRFARARRCRTPTCTSTGSTSTPTCPRASRRERTRRDETRRDELPLLRGYARRRERRGSRRRRRPRRVGVLESPSSPPPRVVSPIDRSRLATDEPPAGRGDFRRDRGPRGPRGANARVYQ